MRTFRVDRIEGAPTVLRDLIVPKPDDYSIAEYSKSVFHMYDTDKPVMVSLKCDVAVMKAVVDMFGVDVDTVPINEKFLPLMFAFAQALLFIAGYSVSTEK